MRATTPNLHQRSCLQVAPNTIPATYQTPHMRLYFLFPRRVRIHASGPSLPIPQTPRNRYQAARGPTPTYAFEEVILAQDSRRYSARLVRRQTRQSTWFFRAPYHEGVYPVVSPIHQAGVADYRSARKATLHSYMRYSRCLSLHLVSAMVQRRATLLCAGDVFGLSEGCLQGGSD